MGKSYCVVCGNERNGIAVQNDYVIESIRWFKKRFMKVEKGNMLVVCKDCYPEYKKRRRAYESRQKTYLALGILFVVFFFIASPKAITILISLFVLALLYFFSLLSYMPKIDIKEQHNQ